MGAGTGGEARGLERKGKGIWRIPREKGLQKSRRGARGLPPAACAVAPSERTMPSWPIVEYGSRATSVYTCRERDGERADEGKEPDTLTA